jgi:FAD/FMN-containing dehydrogenase
MANVLEQLRERVRGQVVGPDEPMYDQSRAVYNAMIDRRPAAVVRCVDAADVMACVDAARDNGLDLSVRGGGHSVPGFGTNDGGVVIDLSAMKGIRVDPSARTARAQGGCTFGDLDHATHAFGMATPGGIISTTGIGGLTLGGGIGYLARGHGLSCDNLLSADVVTADGRQVMASETENADLFWGLRGGSGNFGVVTSMEFRLHPVDMIYGGPMLFGLDSARDILEFYRGYIDDAPREMGAFFGFQIAPPLPFIPEPRHGETMCLIVACWTGDPSVGEKHVQRFRDVAEPAGQFVDLMPYPALNSAFDALLPPGLQHYWKAAFARELTDEAIDAHLEHGPQVPALQSTMHIYPINGAVQDVAPDATAFAYRGAKFAPVIAGMWPDPADNEKNTAWVRDYYAAIQPFSEEGGYINFMAGDDQDRVKVNYGPNYDRLVEVKRRYDPDNLFHVNQNIKP